MGSMTSRIKPYFFGSIDEAGNLDIENLSLFKAHKYSLRGTEIRILLEKKPRNVCMRTNAQNSYYWKVCLGYLSDHTGYTKEEMHEALKHQYLKVTKHSEKEGKTFDLETWRSTSDLDTVEFGEYIEHVKAFALITLGVHIPDPEQVAA